MQVKVENGACHSKINPETVNRVLNNYYTSIEIIEAHKSFSWQALGAQAPEALTGSPNEEVGANSKLRP
jgi:hypothetical protein